jgi:hypothetical protein
MNLSFEICYFLERGYDRKATGMSITLSVFDVFTYAVPGSLYLAVLSSILIRLHWIAMASLTHTNSLLIFAAVAVASYVTGHATYPVGLLVGSKIKIWPIKFSDAQEEFANRVPEARSRPFLRADKLLLQAAIESNNQESAVEVIRLRAVGLMVRNSATPFAAGSMAAMLEGATGSRPVAAYLIAAALLLAAAGLFRHGARVLHLGNLKILELAFWVPGIDTALANQNETHQPSVPQPRMPQSSAGGRHRAGVLIVELISP